MSDGSCLLNESQRKKKRATIPKYNEVRETKSTINNCKLEMKAGLNKEI